MGLRKLFFWFFLAFLPAPLVFGADYQLKEEVVVNGPSVKVKDVLEPAPEGEAAEVKLARLGKPGSTLEINRDLVLLKLASQAGVKDWKIKGSSVKVAASRQVVKGADLVVFGHQYITAQLQALSGRASVEIQDPKLPSDALVPDRPVTLEVAGGTRSNWRGRLFLKIGLEQTLEDGQPWEAGSAMLSYLVKIKQPQLVALRAIARSEKIGPLNSALAEKDTTYQVEEGFSNTEAAYGLNARRMVPADGVILAGMVELPALVKRGDVVRLQAMSGAVRVETSVKVLRDGKKGDSIPVQVLETKKQINAVVVDEKTVQAGAP